MNTGINRIRLEFKVGLIENMAVTYDGLIESDWNLKEIKERFYEHSSKGLIESDWNLKLHNPCNLCIYFNRINRIRLEFKVATSHGIEVGNFWINRIRLEFKAFHRRRFRRR